jgi:hypothetical protein
MEILYSTRTAGGYAEVDRELSALRMLRNDRAAADAAMSRWTSASISAEFDA